MFDLGVFACQRIPVQCLQVYWGRSPVPSPDKFRCLSIFKLATLDWRPSPTVSQDKADATSEG